MESIELQSRRESLANAMLHIESEELIAEIERLVKSLRPASRPVSPCPRCWEDMTPADWEERFALAEESYRDGTCITGKGIDIFMKSL